MALFEKPLPIVHSTSMSSKTISSTTTTTTASSSSSATVRRTSKEEQSKSRKVSGRSNSFNINVNAKETSGQKGVQLRRRSSQMNRASSSLQDQSGESTRTTMVVRLHSGAARKLSVTSNAGAATQVKKANNLSQIIIRQFVIIFCAGLIDFLIYQTSEFVNGEMIQTNGTYSASQQQQERQLFEAEKG